jgi:CheY-like chemotaxis protein
MPIRKILLVDDDDDDAWLFGEAIKEISTSLICERVTDGLEAILFLEKSAPLPDMIFLDLNMPRMDGSEFLKEIKEKPEFEKISIVVLSTSKPDKPIDPRVSFFITKPPEFARLLQELRRVLS